MALADIGWDVEALYRMVLDACRSEDAWEQGMVAPVLHVPNVIEPDLCAEMIALWHTGNEDSGYMKTNDAGKLVGYIDYRRKRRRDHFVANRSPLYDRLNATFARRLIPPIRHAYNYRATRVERFCIAGYDSAEGGYFRRHRDRGEDGHRAFAVTINLNAEGHEGGALWFPEFGRRQYRPRSGDAVIFSGALMHEALPVTAGIRFALLSFVYGEDEAKLRQDYRRRHGSEHETVRVTPMTSG
jgi:predicted 2-oxoglutarate/Fe(II)-dependent dioxygenase YbiX